MTDNSKLKSFILIVIALLGVIAIIAIIVVFAFLFSPPAKPTPTTLPPTSIPSKQYQPESIPLPTYTPNPMRTATVTPTDRPAPVFPTATPPYVPPIGKPLPDLIVASIGEPTCIHDVYQEVARSYLRFTVLVRNIGKASTHTLGPVEVDVYILLGQSSYEIEEWDDDFNAVIGNPKLTISNLDPNWDRTFALAIDMKGITKFGIKAVANSGETPIHEMDRENNTLMQYFSVYCY